jgi:hypothetical protein
MEFHDPHGKVFCENCNKMGKPKGGVKSTRTLSKIAISYEIPEGWVFTKDGELRCGPCGARSPGVVPSINDKSLSEAIAKKAGQNIGPAQEYRS